MSSYHTLSFLSFYAAELLAKLGRLEESLFHFEKAFNQLGTKSIDTRIETLLRYAYASNYIRNNQLIQANQQANWMLDIIDKIEQKNSLWEALAYFTKSVIQTLQGDLKTAAKTAEKAVFSEQEFMLFPIGAVIANKAGNYDEALDILDEYTDQPPNSVNERAVFIRIKNALKKVSCNIDIKTINLPQEQSDKLRLLLNYSIEITDIISRDGANTTHYDNFIIGFILKT